MNSVLVFLSACFKQSKLNLGSEKSFKDTQSFLEKNLTFICHTFPPIIGIPSEVSWTDGKLASTQTLSEIKSSLFTNELIPIRDSLNCTKILP